MFVAWRALTKDNNNMSDQSPVALLKRDLDKSGLAPEDLGAYVAQEAEIAAIGLKPYLYLGNGPAVHSPGYVIPYYDVRGLRVPFYRVKLFHPGPKGARYLQPGNTGSWVYFPQQFYALLQQSLKLGIKVPIIITEGEKKAAKAVQSGFVACALGGIYNWRSKTVILPEDTVLAKSRDGQIIAKLKGDLIQTPTVDRRGVLASGMKSLIEMIIQHDLQVIIVFDSDMPINLDVQKAAAELAFELRFNGVSTKNIRQLQLSTPLGAKMGLDDYLLASGATKFHEQISKCLKQRSSYPTHPNIRELVGRTLDTRIERSEFKELALMILADMDVHGIRMLDKSTGTPFYFDIRTKVLMPVNLLHHHEEPLHETKFGEYLYRQYDISQADGRLITWLAAGFTGEEPVETVDPKSVFTLTKDGLAFQIDDGHYIFISSDPKEPAVVHTNGTNGILFRAGQVEPIDGPALVRKVHQELMWLKEAPSFDDFYWNLASKQFKWVNPRDSTIMTILSYISPWLQRWQGAQLPVELMIGEPGSGKSSMYSLRLEVLTGRAALRNQPTDIRDWYASITSQNGMHVTDNVAFATKEIKQRISDEMCRLVTEPAPTVEMRKLFTTSENLRIPVHIVFAMTAIQQPFVNADIMQRSVIMELSAIGEMHSSDWNGMELRKRGGRIGWLGHQFAILHTFFAKVRSEGTNFWDPTYKSKHRLAHFEQLFRAMGSVLNIPDLDELAKSLSDSSQNQVSEHDWTMEMLKAYNASYIREQLVNPKKLHTTQDISLWAGEQSEFEDNQIATSPRRLARYIKSHSYMVQHLAGYEELGKLGNRQTYRLTVVK